MSLFHTHALQINEAGRQHVIAMAQGKTPCYRASLVLANERPKAEDFRTLGQRLVAICTTIWGNTRIDLYREGAHWDFDFPSEHMTPDMFRKTFAEASWMELRLLPRTPSPVFTHARATLELVGGRLFVNAQEGGDARPEGVHERLIPHLRALLIDEQFRHYDVTSNVETPLSTLH
jgi:hypothetical protein